MKIGRNLFEALESLVLQPTCCRICTHTWNAVSTTSADLSNLECPHCGNESGDKEEPEGLCL